MTHDTKIAGWIMPDVSPETLAGRLANVKPPTLESVRHFAREKFDQLLSEPGAITAGDMRSWGVCVDESVADYAWVPHTAVTLADLSCDFDPERGRTAVRIRGTFYIAEPWRVTLDGVHAPIDFTLTPEADDA